MLVPLFSRPLATSAIAVAKAVLMVARDNNNPNTLESTYIENCINLMPGAAS